MTEIINTLTEMMTQNLWAAPVLSLVAGILTSFTPCSLASVPMLLACVGAVEADRKKAVCLSLSMASGMAVTFGIFGSVASFIGHRMHEAGHWWTILMGILMILMALQVFGVISLIPHIHISEHMTKKGYIGAFFTGALGGVFASHCAIPVMVALLALVAELGQNASGRNGDRLQLCGPGNKKSQICRRGSMAQKNTGRCDPGFWYSADLCRKIADYYCI